jgi:hypothetical protein
MANEMAKAKAAESTINWPGSNASTPGRTMIVTPTSPSTIAVTFQTFMRSPRKLTASSAVQIGAVNSMAMSCASGIMVSASSQANWPA